MSSTPLDKVRSSNASLAAACCLVLIGPPGAGKGTQAGRIAGRYGVPVIATGDALRAAATEESDLGHRVKAIMAAGGLVDDGLMIDLIQSRLGRADAARGFVLDGFPRTLAQAAALDDLVAPRRVFALVLEVPDRELERRLSARRICVRCKTLYSTGTAYGSEEEHCARCGIALTRRDDDNVETIARRLATYRAMAGPLVDYYRVRGRLAAVSGARPPDRVWQAIGKALDDMTAAAQPS